MGRQLCDWQEGVTAKKEVVFREAAGLPEYRCPVIAAA